MLAASVKRSQKHGHLKPSRYLILHDDTTGEVEAACGLVAALVASQNRAPGLDVTFADFSKHLNSYLHGIILAVTSNNKHLDVRVKGKARSADELRGLRRTDNDIVMW